MNICNHIIYQNNQYARSNLHGRRKIDDYWSKLTAGGGSESMCGWLKDKFGISWQVLPASLSQLLMDAEKGPRAMQALLQMKKNDIATLQNA